MKATEELVNGMSQGREESAQDAFASVEPKK